MIYDGDTIKHKGAQFRVSFPFDGSHGAPWEEEDGHGPVSEWKRHPFGMGSKPPKKAGEMILCWDNGSYRTYDFAEAVRIAKRDGWDAKPYGGTRGEKAHRAAMADFKRLRDWCNDRWSYVGVVVELLDDDGDLIGDSSSLWGVESDCHEYLAEVAHELADEVLARIEQAAA